jgi:predicted Zn-dependent protease
LNRLDEARDALTKALEIEPDSANTYVQLGRVHHAGKNYRAAEQALEEALQINPFNPMIYRLLAESYAALGESQKAQAARANLDRLMGAN